MPALCCRSLESQHRNWHACVRSAKKWSHACCGVTFTHYLAASLSNAHPLSQPTACFESNVHVFTITPTYCCIRLTYHQTSSKPLCVLCLPVRKVIIHVKQLLRLFRDTAINSLQQENSGRNPQLMIKIWQLASSVFLLWCEWKNKQQQCEERVCFLTSINHKTGNNPLSVQGSDFVIDKLLYWLWFEMPNNDKQGCNQLLFDF